MSSAAQFRQLDPCTGRSIPTGCILPIKTSPRQGDKSFRIGTVTIFCRSVSFLFVSTQVYFLASSCIVWYRGAFRRMPKSRAKCPDERVSYGKVADGLSVQDKSSSEIHPRRSFPFPKVEPVPASIRSLMVKSSASRSFNIPQHGRDIPPGR